MSDLLRGFASYIRSGADSELHVVSGQDWSDEDGSLAQAQPKQGKAEIKDRSGKIDPIAVGEPEHGRLAFFMDGIERQHIPAYSFMVPIVYGYVAACIRLRDGDRMMRKHDHEHDEALFLPHRLIDPAPLHSAGLKTYNTGTDDKPVEEHPMMLREAARVAISKMRGRLETGLAKKWLDNFQGRSEWLLVDGSLGGTLGGDFQKYESPNIIGVIKSHQTQYFPMEEQRKILSLKAGERSGVFMPLGREDKAPVYSWYLRMWPNDGRDVYFGLIRVEAAADERTLDMVDELSRWLLAERRPLSLPDARWDKMIYPIRDCEQFLKSIAPTKTMLEASMLGLGAG